jgi:hypothetical protein
VAIPLGTHARVSTALNLVPLQDRRTESALPVRWRPAFAPNRGHV